MAVEKDRLGALLNALNTTLNGIDFVEIAATDEKTLRVHFLNQVALAGTITAVSISETSTSRPTPVRWASKSATIRPSMAA